MNTSSTSRKIRLASRSTGVSTAANFTLVETTLPPLLDQQVRVRNLFISVDPYMRGRMTERQSYVPPFEIGKVLEGGAVGEVIESRSDKFKVGGFVTSMNGWREALIAAPEELHAVNQAAQPFSVHLGTLGMTAWAGLTMVDTKAGNVIYISGAAGAVGNMAGQLA